MYPRHSFLKLTIALLVCSISVAAQQATSRSAVPEIAFQVSMSKPHTHMLEVEIRVKRPAPMPVPAEDLLVMPVWTPGSYLVREFARHVQDFGVKDVSGRNLQWEKTNKNTWRIVTGGAREWSASYRVYANELSVRTNQLNSDHAFWTNAALLMYLDGYLTAPSTLHILAPQPWKIATGLPPAGKNTFRAENFDILYDSPVEVSNFKTIAFPVKGVPHRIIIDGEGNYDPDQMKRDVQKIVETSVQLMGGEIPYPDYTFILHLRSSTGGGLEHLNSTALGYPRFSFKPEARYRGFLGLVSHEFFHLWNVKRIRPDALGPFDYTKENYTKSLWVAEGITSYYGELILRRAGLLSEKDYLTSLARAFQSFERVPGRRVMSAEEASFDTWIKYYRQDENSINSQIDYYDKGAIVGLLLDLEIRKLSHNQKSLDDVMRALYYDFFKKGRNYTPADFQQVSERMAGASLEDFFGRYVRGREELDYNRHLAAAGLRIDTSEANAGAKASEKAYLGADLTQEGDRLMVSRVLAGSPAYDQGLNTGDQIVALDNMRANRDFFDARLAEKRPGQLINLTIFRFDDLSALPIKLGAMSDSIYRIVPLENATEEQRRIYKAWLNLN
jgi:predicted metalloprotease with PDZ domain